MLVETRRAEARLDALRYRLLAAGLRVRAHGPQRRADDRMRGHEPQRDARTRDERGPDGCVTVEVYVGLHRAGDRRANGLFTRFDGFAARGAAGLGAGQIALVEDRLAVGAHIDVDAPALSLGRLLIFQGVEALGRRDDNDITPARLQIGRASFGDGSVLGGTESPGPGRQNPPPQ